MTSKLGDVGNHFLFENDQVKVWDLILEPGESSPWHRHTMHHLFVVTEPGRVKREDEDGTIVEGDFALGQVVMGVKDSLHRVTNTGDTRFRNAIAEIKH